MYCYAKHSIMQIRQQATISAQVTAKMKV